jgi:urease accessory protein
MISELEIQAATRASGSYLSRSYFTRPFKLTDISERHAENLHLVMMSASPGILDGDDYRIKIELEAGANVQLYTQSYQRIFNMQQHARQQVLVNMGDGSSFCYLPHPAVPHENSDFESYNRINLGQDCRLLWGEIITCGRKLTGEVFRCRRFRSITEIYQDRLIFKDVTVLQPDIIPAATTGQWEQYTHQASLYWHQAGAEMDDKVNDLLAAEKDVAAGVSRTASGALLIRVLGQGGEQLYALFKKIALLAGMERML